MSQAFAGKGGSTIRVVEDDAVVLTKSSRAWIDVYDNVKDFAGDALDVLCLTRRNLAGVKSPHNPLARDRDIDLRKFELETRCLSE